VESSNPSFLNNKRRCEPDWVGVQRQNFPGTKKPKNILPGDTKLSTKWLSGQFRLGNTQTLNNKANWLQPLGQMFTYCVRGNARYGYIITDEEPVVVCVRSLPENDSQTSTTTHKIIQEYDGSPAARARKNGGILELRAIPWKHRHDMANHDGETLTVNLALWWLHLLATQGCGIEDEYVPLRDQVWYTKPSTPLYSVGYSNVTTASASPSDKESSFQSVGSRRPKQSERRDWDSRFHRDRNREFSFDIDTSSVRFTNQETPRQYRESNSNRRKRRRDDNSDDETR